MEAVADPRWWRTGATATANVRGPIQSIAVTSGGASYTSNPDVTLSSGSGAVPRAVDTPTLVDAPVSTKALV